MNLEKLREIIKIRLHNFCSPKLLTLDLMNTAFAFKMLTMQKKEVRNKSIS